MRRMNYRRLLSTLLPPRVMRSMLSVHSWTLGPTSTPRPGTKLTACLSMLPSIVGCHRSARSARCWGGCQCA
ncbi:unnamed protein product [Ectocarpus sp. 4 AP-2014]